MGLDEKLFYFNLALPRWSLRQWFPRPRTQAQRATCTCFYVLNDGVPVPVIVGQRHQNMKCRGGKHDG